MSEDLFEAVNLDSVATLDRPQAAPLELLDGGEVIELSIKPSLWQIALESARPVAGAALVGACAWFLRSAIGAAADFVLAATALVAILRVAQASLVWASSLYVLTNRRAIRFRGVVRVETQERKLATIREAQLRVSATQRSLRLGTLHMRCEQDEQPLVWPNAPRASEVHARVLRAIRKARGR